LPGGSAAGRLRIVRQDQHPDYRARFEHHGGLGAGVVHDDRVAHHHDGVVGRHEGAYYDGRRDPPLPKSIPNKVPERKDVTVNKCATVPGGWGASGTASNPGSTPATYEITILFTDAGATVIEDVQTSVKIVQRAEPSELCAPGGWLSVWVRLAISRPEMTRPSGADLGAPVHAIQHQKLSQRAGQPWAGAGRRR
jgi:hypothetical protein